MMTAQELSQVRDVRASYGRMMTSGYTHEHAVELIVTACKPNMSDAVLTRALWLDPSIPWCDPV